MTNGYSEQDWKDIRDGKWNEMYVSSIQQHANLGIPHHQAHLEYLLKLALRQQQEIQQLKEVYHDRCEDIDFYVQSIQNIAHIIESAFSEEDRSKGERAGISEVLQCIYREVTTTAPLLNGADNIPTVTR